MPKTSKPFVLTRAPKKSAEPTRKATSTRATSTVSRATAEWTPEAVRAVWEPWRANHILKIMKDDGISYDRAVKRSRRRLRAEGKWE